MTVIVNLIEPFSQSQIKLKVGFNSRIPYFSCRKPKGLKTTYDEEDLCNNFKNHW